MSRVKWRSEMVAWRFRDHSQEIEVAVLFRSLLSDSRREVEGVDER